MTFDPQTTTSYPTEDKQEDFAISAGQWVSAGIAEVPPCCKARSPAYLWPQLAIEASYNIPESMRGQHQKAEAVTSTCKRALKNPEVLQITAHYRAVQAQQTLMYSWLPPQPEGGFKAEGSHNSNMLEIFW